MLFSCTFTQLRYQHTNPSIKRWIYMQPNPAASPTLRRPIECIGIETGVPKTSQLYVYIGGKSCRDYSQSHRYLPCTGNYPSNSRNARHRSPSTSDHASRNHRRLEQTLQDRAHQALGTILLAENKKPTHPTETKRLVSKRFVSSLPHTPDISAYMQTSATATTTSSTPTGGKTGCSRELEICG